MCGSSNLTAFPKEKLRLMIILGEHDLMNIHVPNLNTLLPALQTNHFVFSAFWSVY